MTAIHLAMIALVVSAGAACSSPTAPTQTPPPIMTPPTTPPPLSIVCPSDISVTTSSPSVAVTFAPPAVTGGTPPVEASCTRPSGSLFAPGTTSIQCTARDGANQSIACTFDVKVIVVAPRIGRTRFLAFGDSLTLGEVSFPTSSGVDPLIIVPSAAYPVHLQAMLRARYHQQPGIDVINGGQSGEWAQDSLPRFLGLLSSVRPDAVILLHGYNDLSAQGAAGAANASRSMESLAREARLRGARVFLASLPPPLPGRTHSQPATVVTSYNNQLRAIAQGEGAVFVDVYAALAIDVPRYIGLDGLHPTEAGYLRMAELFFATIRADLELPVAPAITGH